jgi:hypothetical protein
MNSEKLQEVYFRQGIKSHKTSDKFKWHFNLWCSKLVGNKERGIPFERGVTLGFASDAGVSPDTVEDGAHAYWMFEDLCKMKGGMYRYYIFAARRSQYIHTAHFRSLWDIKERYHLPLPEIYRLLVDIVQAEGELSSRDLDKHAREKYGVDYPWNYYGEKTFKSIHATLAHPDTPKHIRKVLLEAYEELGKET